MSLVCSSGQDELILDVATYWVWRDNLTVGLGTSFFAGETIFGFLGGRTKHYEGGISVYLLYTTITEGREKKEELRHVEQNVIETEVDDYEKMKITFR